MYKIIGSGLCIMYIVGNIWAYRIFDFPRIYTGAFPVLSFGPSVWGVDFPFLNGFYRFRFPIFHFPIWIFCAEHRTYIAPGLRGTEGLPLPFPVAFPVAVAFAVALAITDTADRNRQSVAERLRSVCGAWAERESRSGDGSRQQIDRRTVAIPVPVSSFGVQ